MSIDWRTLPSLASLRAFDAVARAGDFAGAARALNVTHAAISQQVRGLEREMGLTLAARSGRSIVLTVDGMALAHALAEGFQAIQGGVEALRAKEAGRGLRIATTPFIVDAIVLPRLSEFWEAHPGVETSLQPGVHYVDIVGEGFDLGLRAGPEGSTWPGLDARLLATSRWLVLAAPSLLASGETDPMKLPWVWTEDMPSEIEVLRGAGVDVDELTKFEVGSAMLYWQATRRGLGISLAFEHVARDDIAAGRLVELPFPGLRKGDGYYAVVPKGRHRPIVDHFVDWLKTIF
ncbi:LysR substrate-binding domain-containing protein [Rhodobacteraceae bacterium]|nr:LysR substrate-binding domain-containing protein [Paracoccaceae bacterium]